VPTITTISGLAGLLQHVVARTDHGHPAVGPQARRMVVAIDHAGFLHRRHHPLRLQIPAQHQLDLLVHPAFGVSPATTQPSMRVGAGKPAQAFGQALDMLQKLRAMGQQRSPGR
jgi:hypothetical protein